MKSNQLRFRAAFLGSAASAALACSGPAFAQVQEEQPAPQEDASAADTDVTEIIVTAQKREERILDIPQSVTVVSGDTLERQQATTFQDYLNQVPGLSLEQSEPGAGRLTLRGVNTGGVASTVAVYIDETPFGSSSGLVNGAVLAADFDPFDVARIEVLRGPQGTLYGASSLGGVLKFVTNKPRLNEVTARAQAGLEFVDDGGTGYNLNGVFNAPLGDKVAFRGTGFYRKRAGWVDAGGGDITLINPFAALGAGPPSLSVESRDKEDINESKVWGGRGSLLFKPTDPLTIRLTAIAQEIKSNGSSDVDVDPDDIDDPIDGFQRAVVFSEPNKVKYRLYNGVLEYEFGFASLLSSTTFGKQNQSFTDDYTAAFGSVLNVFFGPLSPSPTIPLPPPITDQPIGMINEQSTNLKKFTQEVRLASPSNDSIEWLVGAYYTKEKGLIDQAFVGVNINTGEPFTDAVLGNLATAAVKSRYREFAGFANVTWHITDRFDITGGGRWSQNKQSAQQTTTGFPPLVPDGGAVLPEINSKEDVFTYAVSPRFELNDTTAIYARVAKGYRPGGPNIVPPNAGPNVPRSYDADTITSYELGLKTDISRSVSFDLSAYHLKWNNIQLFTVVDNFGLNANGGKARSNGIEATLNVRPIRGLNLSANAALIDAELTEDTPPFVGGFKGDTLPWIPKTSFSLNGDYEWNIGGANTAFVGATLAYTGKQKNNFEEPDIGQDPVTGEFLFTFYPQRNVPAYTTMNLRAGAELGRFTLEAYARNITNTRGITSITEISDELTGGNPLAGGAIRASFIQPRSIGLSLQARF